MANRDIMQEIEELKKQLQTLESAKDRASTEDSPEEPGQRLTEGEGGETGNWLRELIKQAEELMGGLDLQFKDVPAKSALVIFALGVLMGRLLSRRG